MYLTKSLNTLAPAPSLARPEALSREVPTLRLPLASATAGMSQAEIRRLVVETIG
ncbi:hypothetical protein NON00_06310 [Roseomonas sp. GC11]|uniref:hypothetical protein n=1 Tax=Roseomonas sp. GC11 TaxID=2950546 RepID=UPI00210DDA14|nr:hypothetical protein [Roseomonas sp. GC11]MCQ4159535.1 hypothetical protein [Roseomonas sp. GC11]